MNTPTKTTTLAAMKPQTIEEMPAFTVGFGTSQGFALLQRQATMFASSTLVPKEYIGNLPNCAIALNMAMRIGADPITVMQNLVIVHGRPTWSSQFLISTVNTCGRFTAIRYEFFGEKGSDSWGCRAWAIEKATNEKLVGSDITIALAKKEGWHGRNGSKWQSMPQQMLMYRAAGWWTRAYAPELSMGMQTQDEMIDVYDAAKQEDGSYVVTVDELRHASPAAETIDAETGEIISHELAISEVETISAGKKVDAPEPIDLETARGIDLEKQGKALLKALEDSFPADRSETFEQSGGDALLNAMSEAGKGVIVQKIKALLK